MKEQLETLIKDYHWMKKEVERLQNIIYGYKTPMRSWGVARYGDEARMPRTSPLKSQAELKQMDIREERLFKRLKNFEEIVYALELAADYLNNEKDKVIYDCLLDGMSYRAIAYHVGISRNDVRKRKEIILSQLCQKSHLVQLLKLKKSVG